MLPDGKSPVNSPQVGAPCPVRYGYDQIQNGPGHTQASLCCLHPISAPLVSRPFQSEPYPPRPVCPLSLGPRNTSCQRESGVIASGTGVHLPPHPKAGEWGLWETTVKFDAVLTVIAPQQHFPCTPHGIDWRRTLGKQGPGVLLLQCACCCFLKTHLRKACNCRRDLISVYFKENLSNDRTILSVFLPQVH